jgi:hypothetical protein
MNINREVFGELVRPIIDLGMVRTTKYISPDFTIKATRRLYNKKIDGRCKRIEILLTLGPPNYVERKFIKSLIKAKEPFPVKKIILKQMLKRS